MSNTLAVTDRTFATEVEQHAGLTMVDFWAEWCGPCRIVGPIVDRLAEDWAGRAKVAKLDTDANPETMRRFGVRGIPALLFFRDGVLVDRINGAVPRAVIERKLQQLDE